MRITIVDSSFEAFQECVLPCPISTSHLLHDYLGHGEMIVGHNGYMLSCFPYFYHLPDLICIDKVNRYSINYIIYKIVK